MMAVVGTPIAAAAALTASYLVFAALPPVPVPPENPITEGKRVLGKILFWDEQLSTSGTVSCGTCHTPAAGGSDLRLARNPGLDGVLNTPDDVQGSPGIIRSDETNAYLRDSVFALNPQITDRAANTVINAAFAPESFWDGRARSRFLDPETGAVAINAGGALENQASQPLMNNVEMAHAGVDWANLVTRLTNARPLDLATSIPPDVAAVLSPETTYNDLFAAAFGDGAITARRIAFAIATYERTLIADQTPFDRFVAGQQNALTPGQVQGLNAMGPSNCRACHAGDLFTDQTFRNVGLRPIAEDNGRQGVTNLPGDRGKFKVPTLRNVGLKRTFMHNGQFTTLAQVIAFYARAPGAPAQFPDNRDPIMPQVNVPPQVAPAIQDFLQNGLTDPRVANQQFPFDKPTLYTERAANHIANLGGGNAGLGGVVPRVLAASPPMVGNRDFRIGLDGARGGATARLAISSSPPVGGRITPSKTFDAAAVLGVGAGLGFATESWNLRPENFATGQVMYVQWIVSDAAAAGGEAWSNVTRLTFFCGRSGCPEPCLGDRDGDADTDSDDLSMFFAAWDAGSDESDMDRDGDIDSDDIVVFFSSWDAGC